jgi:hypothetical protein
MNSSPCSSDGRARSSTRQSPLEKSPPGIDTSQRADQLLSVMEGSSFIDRAMQDGRRPELDALAQLARMPLRGNP